jgi:hypothetical protein
VSEKALRKLGITRVDDADVKPTKGVLLRVTPDAYRQVHNVLKPILADMGDAGVWTTGSSGSWSPEHPFAKSGTQVADSGDIDVFLDSDMMRDNLGLAADADEKTVKQAVLDRLSKHYPALRISHVHLGFPAGKTVDGLPAYYQVDLFIMPHAHQVARHHEHDYSVKGTPYKGVDQQLAMASLANSVPGHPEKTFQYGGLNGVLKNRATQEVVTRDIDEIAEILLGPGHSASDLGSVESIIAAVGGIKSPRLAQFRDDMAKKYPHLKEGTSDWFRNMRQKLAI